MVRENNNYQAKAKVKEKASNQFGHFKELFMENAGIAESLDIRQHNAEHHRERKPQQPRDRRKGKAKQKVKRHNS